MRRITVGVLLTAAVLAVLLFDCSSARAEARTVTGPYLAFPMQPVAPWEEATIVTNITDYAVGTRNVALFYSTDPSPPRRYLAVNMTRIHGDKWNGDYAAQIPQQMNGTMVYFFTKITDGSGMTYESAYEEQSPGRYYVVAFYPRFEISQLFVENIDSKDLTVDLQVSFNIYYAVPTEPDYITVQAQNRYWDLFFINVPRSPAERFSYDGQLDVRGFHMIGDAAAYPFDSYYVDINFTVLFPAETRFYPQTIFFFQYSNHYIWKYSTTNSTNGNIQPGARINYQMTLDRRVENTYPVILPLMVAFLALGATAMVDSDERLDVRSTIYVALFVFVIGFVPTINTLVPSRASGVTVAEIASYSLGVYLGIFLVCSIFAHFLGKRGCSKMIRWGFDAFAGFASLILLTTLPVVTTPYASQTLFDLIPSDSLAALLFKATIFVGLLYGVAITRVAIAYYTQKEPSSSR